MRKVIKHGTIDDTVVRFCESFEILEMRRNDTVCTTGKVPFQDSFSDGATDLWLRAATEFIDKNEASAIAGLNHLLHVDEMARIRAQVVLNALIVTNVKKKIPKHTDTRALMDGNWVAALHHVLKQPDSFQTN